MSGPRRRDGEPAFVADGRPPRQTLFETLDRLVAQAGAQAADDIGVLEHFALRVAAADPWQVGQDGTVTAQVPGSNQPQQLGQITLARFVNNAGLQPQGTNLFTQTAASGPPIVTQPGLNGSGILQGGYLENSNVQIVNEIVNMIVAQRAYEANSKAIGASDQMLQTAIQIPPFQ